VTRDTVMTQADAITRLQLLFYLPEQAVALVRPGIPLKIKVAPYPDERFAGEVYFVSPTLEAEGRRILVKAWIPNPERRLRPGLFAEIEAEIERRDDALLLPDSALVYDLEGTFVWRVDPDSRAHRVPIEVGLRQDGKVEVAKGLAPGDVVVAAGIHKVKEGQRVRAAGEGAHPVAADDAGETGEHGPS
jgi:membrane fusion protein (multidrug efflux system)